MHWLPPETKHDSYYPERMCIIHPGTWVGWPSSNVARHIRTKPPSSPETQRRYPSSYLAPSIGQSLNWTIQAASRVELVSTDSLPSVDRNMSYIYICKVRTVRGSTKNIREGETSWTLQLYGPHFWHRTHYIWSFDDSHRSTTKLHRISKTQQSCFVSKWMRIYTHLHTSRADTSYTNPSNMDFKLFCIWVLSGLKMTKMRVFPFLYVCVYMFLTSISLFRNGRVIFVCKTHTRDYHGHAARRTTESRAWSNDRTASQQHPEQSRDESKNSDQSSCSFPPLRKSISKVDRV